MAKIISSFNVKSVLIFIGLLILSFVSLAFFSYTTSPFYHEASASDSAIFQIVGKYWAQGYLPYKEVWDIKGPILFFINCLGYKMTGNATGIFFIQWINLSITLVILYKLLRFGFSKIISFCLTVLILIGFSSLLWGGNQVEEYSLPWLSASFYLVYKWTTKQGLLYSDPPRIHPIGYAFVYGMAFGFCLFTRFTNVFGLCGAIFIIFIWLLCNRSFKNLVSNVVSFVAGGLLVTLPFIIYFACKGALYDMWYGTFLYNIEYATANAVHFKVWKEYILFVSNYFDTILLLVVAILMLILRSKRKVAGLAWLCAALLSLVWFLGTNAYYHYAIVSLPMAAVSFVELKNIRTEYPSNRWLRNLIIFLFAFYGLRSVYSAYYTAKCTRLNRESNLSLERYRKFMCDVPKEYKKSFILYSQDGTSDFYIYENIKPACPYFTYQDQQAERGKSLIKYQLKAFNSDSVKWILVAGKAWVIQPVLERKYYIYKKDTVMDEELTLYHIK